MRLLRNLIQVSFLKILSLGNSNNHQLIINLIQWFNTKRSHCFLIKSEVRIHLIISPILIPIRILFSVASSTRNCILHQTFMKKNNQTTLYIRMCCSKIRIYPPQILLSSVQLRIFLFIIMKKLKMKNSLGISKIQEPVILMTSLYLINLKYFINITGLSTKDK